MGEVTRKVTFTSLKNDKKLGQTSCSQIKFSFSNFTIDFCGKKLNLTNFYCAKVLYEIIVLLNDTFKCDFPE